MIRKNQLAALVLALHLTKEPLPREHTFALRPIPAPTHSMSAEVVFFLIFIFIFFLRTTKVRRRPSMRVRVRARVFAFLRAGVFHDYRVTSDGVF